MTQARIVFGELPRLTRDIVEGTIALQEDMRVVGYSADADLERAVRVTGADVVIVQESAGDLPLRLVCRYPHVRVIAISDLGEASSVYGLRIVRLADLSPSALLDAIRAAL